MLYIFCPFENFIAFSPPFSYFSFCGSSYFLAFQQYGGTMVDTSQRKGWSSIPSLGLLILEFACTPFVCVASIHVHWLLPTVHNVRLTGSTMSANCLFDSMWLCDNLATHPIRFQLTPVTLSLGTTV